MGSRARLLANKLTGSMFSSRREKSSLVSTQNSNRTTNANDYYKVNDRNFLMTETTNMSQGSGLHEHSSREKSSDYVVPMPPAGASEPHLSSNIVVRDDIDISSHPARVV